MERRHQRDFDFVQAALRGDGPARRAFCAKYLPAVTRCARDWTAWRPALCREGQPHCPKRYIGVRPQSDCDCVRETVTFILGTLLGHRTEQGRSSGKLISYRGECALNVWMEYLLRRPQGARRPTRRGYGYLELYTDYLRRYRGGRARVPKALQTLSPAEQQVFLQLTRGPIDLEALAAQLGMPLEQVKGAANTVRAALLQRGWDFYWFWFGASQSHGGLHPTMPTPRDQDDPPLLPIEDAEDRRTVQQNGDAAMRSHAALQLLRDAIRSMPGERQLVFVLFFQHGLSAKRIRATLKMSGGPEFESERRVFYEVEQGLVELRRFVGERTGQVPDLTDLRVLLDEWDLEMLCTPGVVLPNVVSHVARESHRKSQDGRRLPVGTESVHISKDRNGGAS